MFLSFKLRKASNTDAIESKRDKLQSDFEKYQAFLKSEKLEKYKALETEVLSDSFQQNKKQIEQKSYKKSPLYKEEKELKRLQKSKKMKTYFKVKNSSNMAAFNRMQESSELKEFTALKKGVDAGSISKKTEPEAWAKYQQLKSNNSLKQHFNFEKSKAFHIYNEIEKSEDLKRLKMLEERINSQDFKAEKADLLDKKRYEKTDDFKKLQEFETMKKSEEFITFFQQQKKNPFKKLEQWELTFCDEFNGGKLDAEKWITNYYWGNQLLGNNYSHTDDHNAFTDKNIVVNNSAVQLKTKKEQHNGLMWNNQLGFVPNQFDYTSGIISTGKSFRQKYGKFEAKIKVSNAKQLQNAFWLLSDKSTPHIDILKTENSKLLAGNYWQANKNIDSQSFKVKGINLSRGYFIYTLEWSADKIVWKINDVVVKTLSQGIPQEPMFLNFALFVKQPDSPAGEMSIDWVRCYRKK